MAVTTYRRLDLSGGYYALLAGTGLVVALGLAAAWYMEHQGHWVTGMDNRTVWGLPHVFAIFLIVAASGVLNVASIGTVFGREAYKPLARLSGLMGIALLVGGLAVLVLDLGRPDRLVVAMTTYNFASIFAWNIFLYVGFLAVVALYLWCLMERRMNPWSTAAGVLAFLWRLVLTTGTGLIFGFLVAREAYDSAALAPLFIAMSFAFGLALFIIALFLLYDAAALDSALVRRLGRLLAVFTGTVLYFTALPHLANLYAAEHLEVERFLLLDGGAITALFWLGQVTLGGILPLALLLWNGAGPSPRRVLAAAVLAAAGGLAQIYVIVIGGQAYPMTLFPGLEMQTAFYGDVARYAPSLPELGLGLGGIALAVLVVAVGLRVLDFLPRHLAGQGD
jgi:molybdopterin-containing oxidoreductase family membrane subunit